VKVVEEELLEQKLRLGFLSEKLARKAKEVAEKLRERLCGKGE